MTTETTEEGVQPGSTDPGFVAPMQEWLDESDRLDRKRGITVRRPLTGDCSEDCLDRCAYPGQFSECSQ
jgi:hypothetical protein